MNLWGHELECASPRVCDGLLVSLAGLIVQNLQVDGVAARFEASHDVVVCQMVPPVCCWCLRGRLT